MKSQMVEGSEFIEDEEKSNYTELRVLHSAAGYYVGTMYQEKDEDGNVLFQEPGSRDSDYFTSFKEASAFLEALNATNEAVVAMVTRNHP